MEEVNNLLQYNMRNTMYLAPSLKAALKAELKMHLKVRSKRINIEGNTHAQEINVSQCPV
jgi:hypothetical protein